MEFRLGTNRGAKEHSALSGKTGAICDEIERRLIRGYYHFGQEILANDLVQEFGASRAPVMAALNYLRAEGYLLITPQVGCKVISPTLSEIEDFLLVFSRVEGALAPMAARRHYADEVALLDLTQQQIQRLTPKKGQPITHAYVDLIADYHRQIHDMCHSRFAAERATKQWKTLDFFLFNESLGRVEGGASLAVADRQRAEIVEAIAARDAVAAGRLMEKHMRDKAKSLPASRPRAAELSSGLVAVPADRASPQAVAPRAAGRVAEMKKSSRR